MWPTNRPTRSSGSNPSRLRNPQRTAPGWGTSTRRRSIALGTTWIRCLRDVVELLEVPADHLADGHVSGRPLLVVLPLLDRAMDPELRVGRLRQPIRLADGCPSENRAALARRLPSWTPPCGMITSWAQVLMKPTEQSCSPCRIACSELSAKLQMRSSLVRPVALTRHDVHLARQAVVGPGLGVEVHPVAALDQGPAQVGDVGLRAASGRVDTLEIQGEVHGSVLTRVSMSCRWSAFLVLSRPVAVALEPFDAPRIAGLTRLSVVRPVTPGAERHDRRPATTPGPPDSASGTAARTGADRGHRYLRHRRSRRAIGPGPSSAASPGQIRRDDSRCRSISTSRIVRPLALEPLQVQEEVAQVQVLVEQSRVVQGRRDPRHLGDHSSLEAREDLRIELGPPASGRASCKASQPISSATIRKLVRPAAWADPLAGRHDVGDLDPERPARVPGGPTRRPRGSVAPRDRAWPPAGAPGEPIMPLQVDRERARRRPRGRRRGPSIGPA